MKWLRMAGLSLVLTVVITDQARAGLILEYLGSYAVFDGPVWNTNPPVYSGREAAVIVFGGLPTDYAISTNSSTTDSSTVNHLAWYNVWGDPIGRQFNEDFKLDLSPDGYAEPGGKGSAISAYVRDILSNRDVYRNYVWRWKDTAIPVPEPSSIALVCTALPIGLGLAWKRRRRSELA